MTDRDKFIQFCQQQLGKPYVLGATGPDAFDCSGLFFAAFSQLFKAQVPRVSTDQFALGIKIEVAEAKPGDLIFFDSGWIDRVPNHNGVCIEEGKMINANSYQGKVYEEPFASGYWSTRIIGVRRVFDADGKLDLFGRSSQVPPFDDVPGSHRDFAEIEHLRKQGVIRGFSDGSFRPDQPVTRAEALKILLLCFQIPLVDADATLFSDISLADWHITYVTTAKQKGIINGYPDGTFRPGNEINRAEIAKIIFETGGISPPPVQTDIPDVPPNCWFSGYALAARERSMFRFAGKNFLPKKPVTRGEMCRAIVRFLDFDNG